MEIYSQKSEPHRLLSFIPCNRPQWRKP